MIDGAFAGTPVGDALVATAERHGLAAEWHPGFQLAADAVPGEAVGDDEWQRFCAGGRARTLAERIGTLDAASIGAADASLQERKYLWKILLSYGEERRPPPASGSRSACRP